jgi:hypothetical protein
MFSNLSPLNQFKFKESKNSEKSNKHKEESEKEKEKEKVEELEESEESEVDGEEPEEELDGEESEESEELDGEESEESEELDGEESEESDGEESEESDGELEESDGEESEESEESDGESEEVKAEGVEAEGAEAEGVEIIENKNEKRIEDAAIIIKEIPFYYLDNSTEINRDIDIVSYLKSENITKININICIYKINPTNFAPYLSFALIEQNKLLKFPNFFREEINDDKDLYMEACKLHILELFHIYPDTNINKINMFFNETMLFKGYFHKTENNTDELLMVFEYKEDKLNLKSIIWATLHEINNTKKVMNISIPTTYTWFLTFPELLYLTDRLDKIIDIPFVLYSLDYENENENRKMYTVTKTSQLFPPFLFHNKIGMKYFFSNNFVDGIEERYVVFITKTLYILDSMADYEIREISKYNSIYFQEEGEPIWAISSVDFFTKIE